MIAIEAGAVGGMLASRLQRSLGIGPDQIVVLSEDGADAAACEVLLVGEIDPGRVAV